MCACVRACVCMCVCVCVCMTIAVLVFENSLDHEYNIPGNVIRIELRTSVCMSPSLRICVLMPLGEAICLTVNPSCGASVGRWVGEWVGRSVRPSVRPSVRLSMSAYLSICLSVPYTCNPSSVPVASAIFCQ